MYLGKLLYIPLSILLHNYWYSQKSKHVHRNLYIHTCIPNRIQFLPRIQRS